MTPTPLSPTPSPVPAAPTGAAWVARPREDTLPDDRARVLVADEDDLTVAVLRHRLERDGLAVETAPTGTEALAAMETRPPDVAVLNVALVGVDGFELLRRIRAGAVGDPAMPVALICWAGNDALVVRAFADDADDVLVRPFALAEVSARVRRLARRAAARRP